MLLIFSGIARHNETPHTEFQILIPNNNFKAKIHVHFKMTLFKGERKNDSVCAKKWSFFNDPWKLKFENVQNVQFLMKIFPFEFKETLLKCIGVELVSHLFSVWSCSK